MDEKGTSSSPVITDPRTQARLLLVMVSVIFLSVLNGTMFNVAVPDIAAEFGLMPSEVSWVLTAYIVVFAMGSATYGKLSDIYQIKNLVTLGLVLTFIGSALGLAARWYPVLVAARMMQGLGGAAIPALSMLVATTYFPFEIRGRMLGAIAAAVALGAGIGPLASGFFAGTFHWRTLFLIPMVTILAIPLYRRLLPVEKLDGKGFDLWGAVLLGGSMAALLVFVTHLRWWLLAAGAVLTVLFARHIRRANPPFIKPSLFSNSRYVGGLITIFLALGSVFGMLFMTPIMLREINGLGTFAIGLVFFPGAMVAVAFGPQGGKLADRIGSVAVVYMGLGCLACGSFVLSALAGRGQWVISAALIISYIGFSLIQASLALAVAAVLPREDTGVGMGLYNLVLYTSGAFGAAMVGKLLDFAAGQPAINPLLANAAAGPYSNIYLIFTAASLVGVAVVVWAFGKPR